MLDVGEQLTISIDILQDGVVTGDLSFNVDIFDDSGNVLDRKVVTILNVDGKYCVYKDRFIFLLHFYLRIEIQILAFTG